MSRFRPVYSTICRCEIFPGERNSFSFSLGPVVKSTSDLVNARPRSFDDVRPDRDANTLGKPSELVKTVGREARSFGSPLRSKAWNTIGIESMGGTILPTDFFLSRHQIFRAKLGLAQLIYQLNETIGFQGNVKVIDDLKNCRRCYLCCRGFLTFAMFVSIIL